MLFVVEVPRELIGK